jgi:hypothetical protein
MTDLLTEHHYDPRINDVTQLAQVAILIGVICRVVLGVSRRAGDLILRMVHVLLRRAFQMGGDTRPTEQHELLQVPFTIQVALSRFNLDSRTTTYAVCPACHCTYKPQTSTRTPKYPNLCTNKPNPESQECNEPLLDGGKPIKTFVYHHFADYLAGLLSRYDIEDAMDKACDNLKESSDYHSEFVSNVFDAEFLRTFEGHEEGKLFVDGGSEGRYVFALNVDFFIIGGLRTRGPKVSCGLISMACLNLPVEIRYKRENMYVAGITPDEPRLTEINHYFRPLVDDMEVAFERGFHFSRTAKFPHGRTTRGAIVAVVNDLGGARKTAATASATSHFYCSVCHCNGLKTVSRTDFTHRDWRPLDKDVLRMQAEKWKNAASSKDQANEFKVHGVRWTEFWRLRYWDPPRMIVPDPMHLLLTNLSDFHVRDVLCLTTVSANAKTSTVPAFGHDFRRAINSKLKEMDIRQVTGIHKLLVVPLEGEGSHTLDVLKHKLVRKNLAPLQYVCDDLGLRPLATTKAGYSEVLIEWVSANT